MVVEKRGVKGGFFQLFDWNAKSRKKLFSTKSISQENSNQGNKNFHGSALARVLQEIEYETKPPGVIARLMGLDSLPTSYVNESCHNPFIEPPSSREPGYSTYPPTSQNDEHDIVIFRSGRNKLDGSNKNPLDARLQKFRTETLPPKSAKPISVTQHRLLSPVKCPRFIPSKTAAYIIEAAAKIMEQSPRANVNGRSPSLGSSYYVPLRIHDLKEKMEYKEYKSIKNSKKHNSESRVPSADSYLYEDVKESKRVGSQRLKSKEKSAPPSVQKRDGLTLVDNRSLLKQNECNDTKNNCDNGNRPTGKNTVGKRSSSGKSSEVLRLNNQKQNCASAKKTEFFEPLSSHTRYRKASSVSTNYISMQANRSVNNKGVVNSVVTNVVQTGPGKEISSSRTKTTSKKKLKNEKSDLEWDKIDNKNNLDVVSFTFTSPIKNSGAGSSLCGTTIPKISSTSLLHSCDPSRLESKSSNSDVPSSEFSVVDGDSLSILLETKIKELTSRIELSWQENSEEGRFSCSTTISLSNEEIENGYHYPFITKSEIKTGQENIKGLEHLEEEDNISNFDYRRYNPLAGSVHKPLNVDRMDVNSGSMQCSSLESDEGVNWISTKNPHASGYDVEISDTASSFSVLSIHVPNSNDPSCWELQYIEYIIYNAELMFEDFALGLAHKIIPPDFFRRLENHLTETNACTINDGERFKLERKVLFDRVGECVEVKCDRILAGSKTWAKQTTLLNERRRLADEVCREISSRMNCEEILVDEIVDKDMSCTNRQWVDFEIEAFEEGVEIGNRILSSLVDELVDDFLL